MFGKKKVETVSEPTYLIERTGVTVILYTKDSLFWIDAITDPIDVFHNADTLFIRLNRSVDREQVMNKKEASLGIRYLKIPFEDIQGGYLAASLFTRMFWKNQIKETV